MVFQGLEHRTAWLVGMGAIAEAAVLGELEDFLEVTGQLLLLHVEGAETLDAWSVDEPGCAVLKAVEEHYIAQSRYQSYLSMLDDKDENKYREAY